MRQPRRSTAAVSSRRWFSTFCSPVLTRRYRATVLPGALTISCVSHNRIFIGHSAISDLGQDFLPFFVAVFKRVFWTSGALPDEEPRGGLPAPADAAKALELYANSEFANDYRRLHPDYEQRPAGS